ncbi:MAG: ABC transporter ATP-binding protein [Acidobacteriota bacterium]
MRIIETFNLCKYYHDGGIIKAIDGVNLKIDEGEFTSIVGPSGSGKTTLLNLLGGIDKPTEGKVILNRVDISSLPEKKLSEIRLNNLGFVFQSFNLIPVLTAFENVEFVLILQGVEKKERRKRVLKALKDVGLEELAHRRLTKLSGGEQQRVAVARAIIGEPKIVLADEPTANLDSENVMILIELMKKLNEEKNITFLLSTHDERVVKMTKRVIKLSDGKIIQS